MIQSPRLQTGSALISKYNVPVPRYTSYPTVPYWDFEPISQNSWKEQVVSSFNHSPSISIYIHLPYCEQLCTYCGCNTRITKQHSVEEPYIAAVLKEWSLYSSLWGSIQPTVKELHIGGGTPTFFSPENLELLTLGISMGDSLPNDREYSFEAHPNSTSRKHLEVLHRVGFNRLSIGVQDFNPMILKTINRAQTEEQVVNVTNWAREIGYQSINFDLIFGLPHQTLSDISYNMDRVSELMPDRIAFYSYAHVPWVKPGQRAYSESDLPSEQEKRQLYEYGKERLLDMGYIEIGMDHFALPSDSLCKAYLQGKMHRNFMGYTTAHTELLIGLGASAISDSWTAFVQNEKKVEDYMKRVDGNEIPFFRGHLLNREDQILRGHISRIMCRLETHWKNKNRQCPALFQGLQDMQELQQDGLIDISNQSLKVTPEGQPFLRNICAKLDARLRRKQLKGQVFSKGV